LVRSGPGLILSYCPGIRLETLRKTTKTLNQGRDFKPGPPEYETGVLTTLPTRSVVTPSTKTFYPRIVSVPDVGRDVNVPAMMV
jgi:hypothetical protein